MADRRRWAALLAAGLCGCPRMPAFSCDEDRDCVQDGVAGTCESAGFCVFPDPACDSGLRYSRHAPGVASECVPVSGTTSTGETGSGVTGDGPSREPSGSESGPAGCVDGDGDGAGVGADCIGPDCDDENPLAADDCIYLSPTGDDAASGSRDAPFATFARAAVDLEPGRSVVLLDGTYAATDPSFIRCDCEADPPTCPHGTATEKIHIRAENDRLAVLEGGGARAAFELNVCNHYTVSGLTVVATSIVEQSRSLAFMQGEHLTIRRWLVVEQDGIAENHAPLHAFGGGDLLIEDTEVYGSRYVGITVSTTIRPTLRRVYVNGRDGETFYGILFFDTPDGIAENVIVENATHGVYVVGDGTGLYDPTDRFSVVGSVVLGGIDAARGYYITSFAEDGIDDFLARDVVSISTWDGLSAGGVRNARIERSTFLDTMGGGVRFGDGSVVCDADLCSATVQQVLVEGPLGGAPREGIAFDGIGDYAIYNSNVAVPGAEAPFPDFEPWDDGEGVLQSNTVIETPGIGVGDGQCRVAIPPASPMRDAVGEGEHIGADLRWRYVDGELTDDPLWDEATGAFPCGAVVEPYNANRDTSCIGVHERLEVAACG